MFAIFLALNICGSLWSTKDSSNCGSYLAPLALQERFKGEQLGKSEAFGASRVIYLESSESRRFLISVESGRLTGSAGDLVDTDLADWADGFSYPTSGIFVMTSNRSIFISNDQTRGQFHHSTFVSGHPVLSAGVIIVKKGLITYVGDDSGHYAPSFDHIYVFLEELRKRGVDLSRTEVSFNYSEMTPERIHLLENLGINPAKITSLTRQVSNFRVRKVFLHPIH